MVKKWSSLLLVTVLSVTALTACTDHQKIKETAQQALSKQTEVKSYQFEGSADLKLSDEIVSSANPLTNGLLSLIRDGKIEWNGAVNTEPVQYEADIKVTPKGAASGIALPIIIKDSKLYFNMPAINKPDEYYEVDLAQMSASSKSPLSADSLKNTAQVSTALVSLIISETDPKWFEEAKEPLQLKDGAKAKSISIEITEKNAKEISALVQNKLPEMIKTLQTNGLVPADQAEKFKTEVWKPLEIKAPGKLSVAIDDQGFIRDQLMDVSFSLTAGNGNVTTNHITLHQAMNSVNQTPAFVKEVPKNIKSFDEVLKALRSKAKP